ncbi:hypothetical protein [Litoribacillus peritrichatus]|uniref:hypothetical protein n=1 Tax=Litoribacillus peritrichatus TaxID=718191 RepID=UPI0031D29CE6
MTIIITVFSIILLIRADNLLSSQSIFLTIPLTAILLLLSFQKPSKGREVSGVTIVIALFVLTVVAPFALRSQLSPWIFLIPILLINFMTFNLNLISISIYCACVFTMIWMMPTSVNAIPTSLSFILVTALCLLMAFLKDQMMIRLAALDIIHPKTGWHVRQELKPALEREIQRAEREGSGLSYSMLDFQNEQHSIAELDWVNIKTLIETTVRPFDQVFHHSASKITIIHPYATTEEVKALFEGALEANKHIPFKAGIASLNIDDCSSDLTRKARAALLCCTPEQRVSSHEA